MIQSYTYAAEESGSRFLVFGAVHGNEICGTEAMRRVMAEIDSGKLILARGQVTFVPVANPRAHANGQRFIDSNLNRSFLPSKTPKTYEAKLKNILAPMIEASDVFLDLHSTTAGGIPFASVEGLDEDENQLAAAMGAEVLLFGWHEAYEASGKTNPDPTESIGTTAYARRHGAKAVLLECGQHKAPESIEVAYHAIRNSLRHLGLTDEVITDHQPQPLVIRATKVVYRPEGGGTFAENWGNFSPVTTGQHVATLPSGDKLLAPADGFIVLPNANTPPHSEWFYFGVKA